MTKGLDEGMDMLPVAHAFIEREASGFGLNQAGSLRVFGVKPSTYTGYCKRLAELEDKGSARSLALAEKQAEELDIMEKIRQIVVMRNGSVPGKRNLQLLLLITFHVYLPVKTCRRYLNRMHLVSPLQKRPYQGQDTYLHQCDARPNLVAQCFYQGYRRVILGDITYCIYDNGKKVCYHAEFYDPYTDQVLGEATGSSMSVELIKEAYDQLIAEHGKELESVKETATIYLHSDNGSQYLETSFAEMVAKDGFVQSFSRRAAPGDNRPMEARYSRLKGELEEHFLLCQDVDQVRKLITNSITYHELFEPVLALGGLTPSQFEQYVLTGIYPVEHFFGLKASDLHPVMTLVERMKEVAKKRTERAKKEAKEHAEKVVCLKDLLKASPLSVVYGDKQEIIKEELRCERQILAYDTDRKIWETLEPKVQKAIGFIMKADAATREDLKDRQNWKKYPELAYIKEYPSYAIGKEHIDRAKLGETTKEEAALWLAAEKHIKCIMDFLTNSHDTDLRQKLEDPNYWRDHPEIAFLWNYSYPDEFEGLKGWPDEMDDAM